MAETEPKPEAETSSASMRDDEKNLKYLDFVQVAAIYLLVCLSSVYELAKENAGPLKLGVEAVEESVKTVLGPFCDKFHDVPFELLKFVDRKVDDAIGELERYVPSLVRQASSQARAMATEVQRVGVVDAARSIATKYEPAARELYVRYEPLAEQYAVAAWRSLNELPLFPEVADVIVPTAAYWTEKYNQAVFYAGERGYPVAHYLPLIPVDKIAEVFERPDESGDRSCGPSSNGKSMIVQ